MSTTSFLFFPGYSSHSGSRGPLLWYPLIAELYRKAGAFSQNLSHLTSVLSAFSFAPIHVSRQPKHQQLRAAPRCNSRYLVGQPFTAAFRTTPAGDASISPRSQTASPVRTFPKSTPQNNHTASREKNILSASGAAPPGDAKGRSKASRRVGPPHLLPEHSPLYCRKPHFGEFPPGSLHIPWHRDSGSPRRE